LADEYLPPVLHISKTSILEGDTYNFTVTTSGTGAQSGAIYYTDADTADEDELITIDNIQGGSVLVKDVSGNVVTESTVSVSFTGADLKAGRVSFVHNGNEAADNPGGAGFDITIQDESSTVTQTFRFTVTAVNDAPTLELLGSGLTPEILEGGTYFFGTGDISYSDPDDTDKGVTYTVTNLQHGAIYVNNVKSIKFTADDIANGKVRFVHDGSEESTAGFDISVEDGNEDKSTPVAQHFTVNIDPTDDPATFSGTSKGTVKELVSDTATGKLKIKDPDGPSTFRVVTDEAAQYGTFSVTADGVWTYKIDYSAYNWSQFDKGETVQDTIVLQQAAGGISVGSTVEVTITIQGTTDIAGTDGDDAGDSALIGTTAADYMSGRGGNDAIYGLAGNDSIYGGTGDDILIGGAGVDFLSGDDGSDTASYQDAKLAVTASLLKPSINAGDAKGDVYVSIENLTGSAFADKLYGDANVNVLNGGAGNDTLDGGAGADKLNGGDGSDTASYAASALGIAASLLKPKTNTGDAKGDTYVSIENLTGSAFADSLTGDKNANTLTGGNGNDVLMGGAGADKLDGGGGLDTASYAGSAKGVIANMLKPSVNTGDAKGDVYAAIENLTGSAHADQLTGNYGANVITGGAGADKLWGGAGADTFVFAAGDTGTTAKTRDVIEDFSHAQHDIIDLIAIDANTKTVVDDHFTIFTNQKKALATIGSLYIETHGKDYTIWLNNDAHKGFDMAIDVEGNKPVITDFHL
jgi:VCBS repeat-containing protein